MIVTMIQNLENKMELQIKRLEIRIQKMQEMFNKDLEEKVKGKREWWKYMKQKGKKKKIK